MLGESVDVPTYSALKIHAASTDAMLHFTKFLFHFFDICSEPTVSFDHNLLPLPLNK